jgi:glycosyltransferase involved in cell wall biosynthesis/ubiquinone/menaquinone biosynthesis C-methylase UbiE
MQTTSTIEAPASDRLRWLRANLVGGGAIAVSRKNRRPYPEVTGYLIPNLLALGERDLARRFGAFLVATQRPDGAFGGPDCGNAYAFDTGQALRGLCALADIPQCRAAARRAAEWLCTTSTSDGRLALPADLAAWDIGPRGRIPEAVHLYVLPALVQAGEVLDEPRYGRHALRARDAYLRDRRSLQFANANMLSHFFGYAHEALVDLGCAEVADEAFAALQAMQSDDGAVPAYHDVPWICLPGQLQAVIVLAKLGHERAARRALAFAERQQLPNGGFPGSVGRGAAYFADDEPSWAVKFWLDAKALLPDAESPESSTTAERPIVLDRNLAPDEWHDSICDGQRPSDVAERVRAGEAPAWFEALLETTAPGETCLELGSGTGELSARLQRRGRAVSLLDFSQASLDFARELFDRLGAEGAFVRGDVLGRLPHDDCSVDVVWSSGLLEHFEPAQIDHIVRESARVARRRVVALVPNAKSLPYRLGKDRQERTGEWTWGKEEPFATLRDVFARAGLVDVREWTVAPEHALQFLTGPEQQEMRRDLAAFYATLSPQALRAMDQGYLLVTVGTVAATGAREGRRTEPARRTRRLAVLPNDPLDAYPAAGYPDLTSYFNPDGAFDEVWCLSPHEPREKTMYGMRVVPTTQEELPARIRELGIDVVRAYCLPTAQFACRDKVPGVRYVVSVHDVAPERCPAALPDADLFLAVSGEVERFLAARGAPAAIVERLSNRVDLSVFRPIDDAAGKAAWQARFPGRYRVLHVGRRAKQKNLDTLIRALGALGPDYVGVFVGQGDALPFRALAAEVGAACHFVDAVPNAELARWYAFADVMCTPSRWEGFGIVFAEALASGALVVTSDVAPMNEFVTHEQDGLLVERFEDPDAIAAALRRATEDAALARRLRAAAPAAAKPFGKQAVDARERGFYERCFAEVPEHVPQPRRATPARDLPGSMRLHLRRDDLRAAWDAIATTSPDAWVYHLDDWQRCQMQAFPLQDLSFLLEWEGRPVAIFPIQRNVHAPRQLRSTFMGTGGPALRADLGPEERAEVLRLVHRGARRFLETGVAEELQVHIPQLCRTARAHWTSFVNPLVAHGYRHASTQTSLVDLRRDEEGLFMAMRQRHRNSVRRAMRQDIRVGRLVGRDGMDAYYRLHVETYTRTGVPPHPKSYFDAIADHMVGKGHAETFAAWLGDELVAAANVAFFGDGSLYWTGAYSQRGLDSGAGKLLQWEIIRAQKAAGRVYHETGEVFPDAPAGSKELGLTTYKAGFGGELRPWFKGLMVAEDVRP